MTYELSDAAQISTMRQAILDAAPDPTALAALVSDWSSQLDQAISEIDGYASAYRGPDLRVLLDWSDSWADAYYDPEDWAEYASYVTAAQTEIEV